MTQTYRRIADGMMVDGSEALDERGAIRSGYGARFVQPGDYIGFDMAFLDHAPVGRMMFRDADPARPTVPPSLPGARELRDAIRANRHNADALPQATAAPAASLTRDTVALDAAAVRDLIRANRNR
jgi:hypothetical protein